MTAQYWYSNPFVGLDETRSEIADVKDTLLAMNDSPHTIAMYRNLSFKPEGKPEIVYKISATLHIDSLVFQLPHEEVDSAIANLFSVLEERILIWFKIATDFYLGFEDVEISDTLITNPQAKVPHRYGLQNNVEVWGTVMNVDGKWLSMKITDKTDPIWQYELLKRSFLTYDYVTRLSDGKDLNNGGNLTAYTKIVHDSSYVKSKKKTKEVDVPDSENASVEADSGETASRQPEYTLCSTYEEIGALEKDSRFAMPIMAMTVKGNWITLYPYTRSGDNELILSSDGIFMARDNKIFVETILPKLQSYGIDLEAAQNQKMILDTGFVFLGTKKLSPKGVVWYSPSNIVKE